MSITLGQFLVLCSEANIQPGGGGGGGGSGTVTQVNTGNGLTGGPITTSGTIALAVAVASGVMVSSAGSVASFSTTLPAGLTIPGYLQLAGGTMTGNLVLNAAPTATLGAATKGYVDTASGTAVQKTGSTMTGALYLASDPTTSTQAATKNYVDIVAAGLAPAGPVAAASTANIPGTYYNGPNNDGANATYTTTANAPISFDGIAGVVGQPYLIKDNTDKTTLGIYQLTTNTTGAPAVLTRSARYNSPDDINNTGVIPVQGGVTQAGYGYYNTTTISAVGTSTFLYMKFGNTGTVSQVASGTGLTGGPITGTGTLALAPIASSTFLANTSGASAAPIPTAFTAFLQPSNNLSELTPTAATARNNILAPGTVAYAGNPNGFVAGARLGDFVLNTAVTPNVLYICTTTGNAIQAVWSVVTSSAGTSPWSAGAGAGSAVGRSGTVDSTSADAIAFGANSAAVGANSGGAVALGANATVAATNANAMVLSGNSNAATPPTSSLASQFTSAFPNGHLFQVGASNSTAVGIDSLGNFTTYMGIAQYGTNFVSASNAGSTTLSLATPLTALLSSVALNTYTCVLPTPTVNQRLRITAQNTISNLTLTPSGSDTLLNTVSFLAAGTSVELLYRVATTSWIVYDSLGASSAGLGPALSAIPVSAITTAALSGTTVYNNGSSGLGATITITAASIAIDGINITTANVGQLYLIKNQAIGFQNGVYYLTSYNGSTYVFTRPNWFCTPAQLNANPPIYGAYATSSSLNNGQTYYLFTPVTAVGTTGVAYSANSIKFASTAQPTITSFLITASATAGAQYSTLAVGGSPSLMYTAGGTFPSWITTIPSTIPLTGVINGVAAASGLVGEIIQTTLPASGAVGIPNNTAANVITITLTPGDWDIYGNVYLGTQGLYMTQALVWVSTVSATIPDASAVTQLNTGGASTYADSAPAMSLSVSASTIVYLGCYVTFNPGTVTACGKLLARRRR